MDTSEVLGGSDQYESDFYSWTQRQATLIREGRLQDADLANIAEEIESLGRSQVSELRSRYGLICLHLLNKIVQPERDGRSWTTTIVTQRLEIARHLQESPGLRHKQTLLFAEAYRDARKVAASETGIDLRSFPIEPPFTSAQAEDEDWWPVPGA